MPLEDLTVACLAGFSAGRGAVVDGERGLVQIALKLEAGLAHKFFVLRIAVLRRLLAEVSQKPNWFEVEVKNRIGIGQEADGVRSGALAQQDGSQDTAGYEHDNREGNPQLLSASPHGRDSMIREKPAKWRTGRQLS